MMLTVSYLIAAYAIGMLMTAWLAGRLYGVDLHRTGSGNMGARNAGETIGKTAFLLVFLGDAGKGALVVAAGYWFHLPYPVIAAGFMAVMLGHLLPLHRKGGKGIATFIGGYLTLDPLAFGFFAAGFIVLFLLIRSATLAVVGMFALFPLWLLWDGRYPPEVLAGIAAVFFIILVKHRSNVKESWQETKVRFAKK